ncbi:MAG: hypothetical protein JWM86_2786 [Thermoleophilia bacterium]|nr:hypothetical protein [Thermoleophilia bacterium]
MRRNGARAWFDEEGMGTDPIRLLARACVAFAVLAAGVLLAGCDASSLRSDPTDSSTRILGRRAWVVVTTDGGRTLVTRRSLRIQRGDTALDALQSVADVRLTPEGTIAQVNGEGGGALRTFGPEEAAWFYRVDGIETLGVRPDRYRLQPGQSVWWDLRRTDIYERLPVAVGTFPEPLFSGWRDAERPLRISYGGDFQKDAEYFRDSVFSRLDPNIVSISGGGGVAGIGGEDSGGGDDRSETAVAVRKGSANLILARWEDVRLDPNIADIGFDPRAYGLTIWIEGTEIRRQDPDMEFSERLQDAEGLVWASTTDGEPDGTLVFLITGTTDEGVHAAARALRSGSCQFYLACAVDREGRVIR